jgi:hypothetical protein
MSTEQPIVVAYPNAPGWITLTWNHSGEGVYWFVVEQESPYTFWLPDRDKRIWTVMGLEPNHTYRYRVCAVYDLNRVCSDEGGAGWVSVTTFPPEQHPVSPPPPPPSECGCQLPRDISSFESVNHPGYLMRHRNFLGELTQVVSDLDRSDATFVERIGLTGALGSVSLESVNYPGYFLRHQDFRIKLHRNDGSDLFHQDATFTRQTGDHGEVFQRVRYESVNFPGHFIRQSNFELSLVQDDGSDLFKQDSTWRRLPPPPRNLPPGTVSFNSFNYPSYFMRHRNFLGELSLVASDLDRADTTFTVRSGLNGSPIGVSLESVNYPGSFLRHQDFRIKLQPNDGSDLFRQDATFMYNNSQSAGTLRYADTDFESVNFPGYFIRHSNYQLWLAQRDGSDLFNNDATWEAVPPLKAGG